MPTGTQRRRTLGGDVPDDGPDLLGHGAAVGVAEDEELGAGLGRGLEGLERVAGVGLPAVEEVLGVEDHLAARSAEIGDALGDHLEVLFLSGVQDLGGVERRRLADDGDGRSTGSQERRQALVLLHRRAFAPGHAERTDPGAGGGLLGDPLEVVGVLRVRRRIAPLDVVEAEAIQPPRQQELVLEGETDSLALGAVAQGRVVDLNSTHGRDHPGQTKNPGAVVSGLRAWVG